MIRKILGISMLFGLVVAFAGPTQAGFSIKNLGKKATGGGSSGGVSAPGASKKFPMDQRKDELNALYDQAPDKKLGALTKYFTKKLGAKPGYRYDGASPSWLVRSHQKQGSEYCVSLQLSIAGQTYMSNEKHLAKAHLDMGSSTCDHPRISKYAPLVWEFLPL